MSTAFGQPTRGGTQHLATILIATVSLCVFARTLFVDNAVVFQDEYVYKASGDRMLDQTMVLERGLSPPLPNRLFLSLYGLGSYFGSNYYVFAQFLNVVFWALGLLALYRLAALSGLSPNRSLAFLAAAAMLPLSTYTKFFMPESLFFALFCASVYALMLGIQHKLAVPVLLAGALGGLLYFVKPHALVLMAANVCFLLVLPGRLRLLALFGAGLLGVVGVGRWAAPARGGAPSLGLYQYVLDEVLGRLLKSGAAMVNTVLEVAAGHAFFWFGGFGLSLLVVVSVLVPKLRLRKAGVEVPRSLWLMSLYLLITGLALVGMAVGFSSLVGDVGRIHSRYYFFLYPLALLVLFQFDRVQLTLGGKVIGLIIAIVGPALVLGFAETYSWMLYMSLVGDGPELGFAFFSKPWSIALTLAAAIAGVATVLRPQRLGLLLVVFSVTAVISSIDVTLKQKSLFREPLTIGRPAVAAEEFLGTDKMVGAVVVGEQRDQVTKFLFYLSTTPSIQELPPGSNLEQIAVAFPQSTHVIALSESYVLPAPLFQCTTVGQLRVCTITR